MTVRELIAKVGWRIDPSSQATADAAIERTRQGLQSLAPSANAANQAITGALGALRGWLQLAVGVAAVKTGLLDYVAEADAARRASESLGLSASTVQLWTSAGKSARIESEQMTALLGKIAAKAADAAKWGQESVMAFNSVGVAFRGADGKARPLEQLLPDLANAFQRMPPGAERTRAAIKLFEESGPKLLPILSQGAAGLEHLRAQLTASGVILSGPAIESARKFQEGMKGLKLIAVGFRNALVGQILPALVAALQAFQKWWGASEHGAKVLHVLKVGAMAAAAALAYMGGAAIVGKLMSLAGALKLVAQNFWSVGGLGMKLPMIATILAAVAAVMLLEDAIRMVRGERNVLDGLISDDTRSQIEQAFKAIWTILKDLWNAIGPAVRELGKAFSPLARMLSEVLGPIMPYIGQILRYLVLTVAAFVWGALAILKGLIQGVTWVIKAFRSLFEYVERGARMVWSALSPLIEIIYRLGSAIVSTSAAIAEWVGAKLVSPFLDGIRAAYQAVADAANRALKAARAVREFFVAENASGTSSSRTTSAAEGLRLFHATGQLAPAPPAPIQPVGPIAPPASSVFTAPTSSRSVTNSVGSVSVSVTAQTSDPAALAAKVRQAAMDAISDVFSAAHGDFEEATT